MLDPSRPASAGDTLADMASVARPNDPMSPEALFDAGDPEQRWAALLGRDRRGDGHFVFAVRTTGVYCRPSCAARTPKRVNVAFFDTPALAREAGFRACKRCHPDTPTASGTPATVVSAMARRIDAAVAAEAPVPSLAMLARAAGYSPFHFQRLFKDVVGLSPKAYAAAARRRRMAAALGEAGSVTEAIQAAGYSSSSRFYEKDAARLGMEPQVRARGGAGEAIRHAVAQSTLGPVLVAATERGVCAILFGDDATSLESDLAARFPKASLARGDAAFSAMVEAVLALVADPGRGHDLPLDIRGTAFQERVWQALQAIPPGRTVSYAELAAAIGRPTAARGVARACASNRIAVAVPCHRVVRGDGDLSGYRWGVERKAALLARERDV